MGLRILLNGAKGRMGQAIAAAAPELGLSIGAATDVGDNLGAALEKCDVIIIDDEKHSITVDLPAKELAARRKKWKQPKPKATRGTLAKYIRLVKPASMGCVTDE